MTKKLIVDRNGKVGYMVIDNKGYGTVLYHSNNELYHFGRKGMKWGKHLFGLFQRNRPDQYGQSVQNHPTANNTNRNSTASTSGTQNQPNTSRQYIESKSTAELNSMRDRYDAEKNFIDSYNRRYGVNTNAYNVKTDFKTSMQKAMVSIASESVKKSGTAALTFLMNSSIDKLTKGEFSKTIQNNGNKKKE